MLITFIIALLIINFILALYYKSELTMTNARLEALRSTCEYMLERHHQLSIMHNPPPRYYDPVASLDDVKEPSDNEPIENPLEETDII